LHTSSKTLNGRPSALARRVGFSALSKKVKEKVRFLHHSIRIDKNSRIEKSGSKIMIILEEINEWHEVYPRTVFNIATGECFPVPEEISMWVQLSKGSTKIWNRTREGSTIYDIATRKRIVIPKKDIFSFNSDDSSFAAVSTEYHDTVYSGIDDSFNINVSNDKVISINIAIHDAKTGKLRGNIAYRFKNENFIGLKDRCFVTWICNNSIIMIKSQHCINLYDAKTFKRIGNPIKFLELIERHDSIILVKDESSAYRAYDLKTGRQKGCRISGVVLHINSTGTRAIESLGEYRNLIRIRNVTTGKQIGETFSGHDAQFNLDGTQIFLHYKDYLNQVVSLTAYNVGTGKKIWNLIYNDFVEINLVSKKIKIDKNVYDLATGKLLGKYDYISSDLRYCCTIDQIQGITIYYNCKEYAKISVAQLQKEGLDIKTIRLVVFGDILQVSYDSNALFYDLLAVIEAVEVQETKAIASFPGNVKALLDEYILGVQPITSEKKAALEKKAEDEKKALAQQALIEKDAAERERAPADGQKLHASITTKDEAEKIGQYMTRHSMKVLNEDRETALLRAVRCDAPKIIELLLKWRSEEYVETEYHKGIAYYDLGYLNQGVEAVCLAIEQQKFEIACLIASRMTHDQWKKRNKNGKTILELLAMNKPNKDRYYYDWLKIFHASRRMLKLSL
jgi:hypothetical protein